MSRLVQIAEIMIIAVLCGALIFSISGCDSKNNPGDSGDGSEDPHAESLLANGDFEQSEKGMPKFWDTASWRTNGIKFNYLHSKIICKSVKRTISFLWLAEKSFKLRLSHFCCHTL